MNARDFKTVLEILAESGGGDLTVDELVARLLERAEGGDLRTISAKHGVFPILFAV